MFSGGFEQRKKVLPGFEPGSENSKSSVITDYTIGPLIIMLLFVTSARMQLQQTRQEYKSETVVWTLSFTIVCTYCSGIALSTQSCSSFSDGKDTFMSLHLLVRMRIESRQLRGKKMVQPSVLSTATVGTDTKHCTLLCLQ